MGFIKRAWRGEEKLWKVFWIWWLLTVVVLIVILVLLIPVAAVAFFPMLPPFVGLLGLFLMIPTFVSVLFIIILPYIVWVCVSVWRCAWNAKLRIWGYLSRVIVILPCLYAVYFAVPVIAHVVLRNGSTSVSAPSLNQAVPPAAPAMDACEQRMHDFAVQYNPDPKAYIVLKQSYLAQCREALAAQKPKP
jgi:hypothetical protein